MTSPSSNNQNLYAYSKRTYNESLRSILLLPPNASPAEVRKFLTNLLITYRGIPLDHAQQIAAHWTLGTGREISTYSAAVYIRIFGPENGWILYKEIRVLIWKKKCQQDRSRGVWLYVTILALLLWNVFMYHMFITTDPMSILKVFAVFGIFGGCMGICFVGQQIYLHWNYDPEEEAEAELREATTRTVEER